MGHRGARGYLIAPMGNERVGDVSNVPTTINRLTDSVFNTPPTPCAVRTASSSSAASSAAIRPSCVEGRGNMLPTVALVASMQTRGRPPVRQTPPGRLAVQGLTGSYGAGACTYRILICAVRTWAEASQRHLPGCAGLSDGMQTGQDGSPSAWLAKIIIRTRGCCVHGSDFMLLIPVFIRQASAQ